MKAKQYMWKLIEAAETNSELKLMDEMSQMLEDLIKDADNLIETRRASTNKAIESCVLEVNEKYKAILRLHNKYKEENPDSILSAVTLVGDGFKACYVELHPDRGYIFDIKKHKEMMDQKRKEYEEQKKALENFVPHAVTPYEELTMDNIYPEFFACLQSLANSHNAGVPIDWLRPLAGRIALLKYWIGKKEINLDEVKEYEKDPQAWVQSHQ